MTGQSTFTEIQSGSGIHVPHKTIQQAGFWFILVAKRGCDFHRNPFCFNMVRKRGLETGVGHFRNSSNARHTNENTRQNTPQLSHDESVTPIDHVDVPTDFVACPSCEYRIATTKTTQGLHKHCTRVLSNTEPSADSPPSELADLISAWPHLPKLAKEGIKALVAAALASDDDAS